jgi:hypothetical protein
VAALITQELHAEAVVEPGGRGEFSVWAGDVKVVEKTRTGFPADAAILAALKAVLQQH